YHDSKFIKKVTDFTDGALCDIVYDSVGKDTFDTSLFCVKRRGMMVAYGNGSGAPNPIEVLSLMRQGSVYLTRPRLDDYATTIEETEACATRFFNAVISGEVTPRATQTFQLQDAPAAHRHLEDREQLTTPVLMVN
ncbi:MAG: zinc-binding dehydrogenase, partial [Gammaproteobacteria bacterium]